MELRKRNISLHNGIMTVFVKGTKTVNKKKIPTEIKKVIHYKDCVCIGTTEEEIKRFIKPRSIYKDYKGERFFLSNIVITIEKVGTKTNYKL